MSDTFVEPEYFNKHRASLRIMGEGLELAKITQVLELQPDHIHKKGEIGSLKKPYATDMWSYTAPVPRTEDLDLHLKALWAVLKPHTDFLLELKQTVKLDVFCSYSSNSATSGFGVSPEALEIISVLQINLEVSVFFV